jgi:hypothetical protein
MKTSSQIAVINRVNIPVKAIENYINTNINRCDTRKRKKIHFNAFSYYFENIDCCSAYVPVNGVVEISLAKEGTHNFKSVNVNVSTIYFFTCAKGKDEIYKMAWGTSLS